MTCAVLLTVALAALAALAAMQVAAHDRNDRNDRMKEVLAWKELDFKFATPAARAAALRSGAFIPANANPLAIEVWNDKVFVTVPRWRKGVPSSVNYIKYTEGGDKSPILIPYPNLETNTLITQSEKNALKENELPHKIVSVFRVRADACDRLWVMDTGLSDIRGDIQQLGPAKLLIYDLKTDKLLRQYALKPEDLKQSSFFANVVVDTTKQSCDNAFAYLPDLGGYGLVVYSWKDNASWRINHNYFYFDPLSGNYNVAGINFQWTDGMYELALSPVQRDGFRTVYFNALSSTNVFKVSTRILQNKNIANLPETFHEFTNLGSRGPNSQSTSSYLEERTGVLFYTQVSRNGLGCWNTRAKKFSRWTNVLLTSDKVTMIFPSDLKIDTKSNIWMLSNRVPIFHNMTLDPKDVNYRVFRANTKEIIKGTVCDAWGVGAAVSSDADSPTS